MLIQPLQKIEVINSSKQCKTGSIGYVIHAHNIGGYNLLGYDIMFTKFGKSGKPRISLTSLVAQFVDIESLSFNKEHKGTIEKVLQDYMMPYHYGRRESSAVDSYIKMVPIESKDLTELETWEFMTYISTLSMFIEVMEGNMPDLGRPRVRERVREADVLNMPIAETPPSLIGHYISLSFKNRNGRVNQKFDEYIAYFSEIENRRPWIEMLRKRLSVNRQAVIRYSKNMLSKHTDILHSLKTAAKDEGVRIRILTTGG